MFGSISIEFFDQFVSLDSYIYSKCLNKYNAKDIQFVISIREFFSSCQFY